MTSRKSTTTTSSTDASAIDAAKAKFKNVHDVVHDFDTIQSQRPDFDHANAPIPVTKPPNPNWQYGQGATLSSTPDQVGSTSISNNKKHHEIDPYAPDRPMINNYRLLLSSIAPRPIGFLSTISLDGKHKSLAPFSYFQIINHDPPMFIVGFASRPERGKDTFRNLRETGEVVINTVSEHMIEAVVATSIDAPYGVSEWEISGLHEAPSTTVRPSRVQESVFSVEGKVYDIKDFEDYAKPGMSIASMVLIKATRFWVQDGASNAEFSHIDLNKLRPVGQLGGISYGRVTSTFELPRKIWQKESPKSEFLAKLGSSSIEDAE